MRLDDPRHGSYAGACQHRRDGETHCAPCVDARRRYLRRRYKLRQMNRPGYLPLTRSDIAKIALARRYGWPLRRLAADLGCAVSTVWRIERSQPGDLAQAATVVRLRTWRDPLQRSMPTGIGTLRRLQALTWCGYTGQAIADLCGVGPEGLTQGIKYGRTLWLVSTRATIAAHYEQLASTPPTGPLRGVTRARNTARALGYAPPAAWDDIDDAHETPKGVAA